jgi:hypothetical protein
MTTVVDIEMATCGTRPGTYAKTFRDLMGADLVTGDRLRVLSLQTRNSKEQSQFGYEIYIREYVLSVLQPRISITDFWYILR